MKNVLSTNVSGQRSINPAAPPADGNPCSCEAASGGRSVHDASCGAPTNNIPLLRVGQVAAAYPLCAGDVVRPGRANMAVPEFAIWAHLGRAATFSPREPLVDSDTKAGGTLTMTLEAEDITPSPTEKGNIYLAAGLMIEIMTVENVPVGQSVFDLSGYFEDGEAYSQTVKFTQKARGTSRLLVLFGRSDDDFAYPSLVRIQREVQVAGTDAYALTAGAAPNDATTATPTNGIRSAKDDLTVQVTTGATDTQYRVELVTPVSVYWQTMLETVARAYGYGGGR